MYILDRIKLLNSHVSGIILPLISIFIAYGIIAIIGIDDSEVIRRMITWVILPVMISYTCGRKVHGERGGVVAVISSLGLIFQSSSPMIMLAVPSGLLSGYILKQFEQYVDKLNLNGMDMLIRNYSVSIIGLLIAIINAYVFVPVVIEFTEFLVRIIDYLVHNGWIALSNIIIEPLKVMFLNNGINYGVLTPLGILDVDSQGKSMLFLLEANPGPGLGILIATYVCEKDDIKISALPAMFIQFFGGIHEVYFPYVIRRPILIVPLIVSGCMSSLLFSIFDVGLVGPASPGSIAAIMAMSAPGDGITIWSIILLSIITSTILAIICLKYISKDNALEGGDEVVEVKDRVKTVVFVCDAGIGSSAMASMLFRKMAEEQDIELDITNSSISTLEDKYDLIITYQGFSRQVESKISRGRIEYVDNFLNRERYSEIIEGIK